jgi:hypothetical protein
VQHTLIRQRGRLRRVHAVCGMCWGAVAETTGSIELPRLQLFTSSALPGRRGSAAGRPGPGGREIYRRFGWTFDDQTRARMEGWHSGQAARRQAERRHRYALSDYGLTEDQVDDAFSGYTEFTRAHKIRMQ